MRTQQHVHAQSAPFTICSRIHTPSHNGQARLNKAQARIGVHVSRDELCVSELLQVPFTHRSSLNTLLFTVFISLVDPFNVIYENLYAKRLPHTVALRCDMTSTRLQ